MLYCNVPSTPQSFLDCTEGTSANFIFQYDLILLYHRQKTMAIFAGNWVDISLLTANNGSLAFMAATGGGWGGGLGGSNSSGRQTTTGFDVAFSSPQ